MGLGTLMPLNFKADPFDIEYLQMIVAVIYRIRSKL